MAANISKTLLILAVMWTCGSTRAVAEETDPSFTHRESFVAAHPGMYWFRKGVKAHEQGRFDEAMNAFHRAARHADKTSQAMISLMLWNGEGVARDRAMAYVWADLAAERGYPRFVATRERFWTELDSEQRHAALAAGPGIFDEYADDVAKRREERALRRARFNTTGSRVGNVGSLTVNQRLPDGRWESVDGDLYYADKYWQPEAYWQWREHAWTKLPEGKVEVLPLRPLEEYEED